MTAPKSKTNKSRATARKGGYVAKNPVPEAIQRKARDQEVAEKIMSEIEETNIEETDGLLKLLDVLERRQHE